MTIAVSNVTGPYDIPGYRYFGCNLTFSSAYVAAGDTLDLTAVTAINPYLPAFQTPIIGEISGTAGGYTFGYVPGTTFANGKVKICGRTTRSDTTSAATAGTSEEILATYTVPAGTLSENGMWISMEASGITAANTNSKVLNLRFGGIGGTIVATATTTTSAASWYLKARVLRTGATAQATQGWGVVGTVTTVTTTTAAQTLANAITFVVTGTTASAAGDATYKSYTVEYGHQAEIPAATYPTQISGDTNITAVLLLKR